MNNKVLRLITPLFIAVVMLFGGLAYLADNAQASNYVDNSILASPNWLLRATMPVTSINRTGITQTLTTGDATGHKFSNDGKVFVIVTTTASRVITFVTPGTIDGLDIEDLQITVATTTRFIGPFPPQFFNQITGSDKGYVYIDIDSATGLTIAAYKVN